MKVEEVRQRGTLSVRETAEFMQLGLNQTYAAIKRQEIPSLHLGGKILIPAGKLLQLLGHQEPPAPGNSEGPVATTGPNATNL